MTTHVLETGGQVCPFPLVEAQKAIAGLPVGDRLTINFDCTQATESIPEWAATPVIRSPTSGRWVMPAGR